VPSPYNIEFALKSAPLFSDRVRDSYFALPADRYLQAGQVFRQRRFSKVRVTDVGLAAVDDTKFFQDSAINHYAGGMNRLFDPVEPDVLAEFSAYYSSNIGSHFAEQHKEVGFHQIRITCATNYVGYPVPEGWHKDGYDFIAMMCVSAVNMSGGISRIREDLSSDKDFFTRLLKPGEILILNDHRFNHFTDPINMTHQGDIGYRDMLVVTISCK